MKFNTLKASRKLTKLSNLIFPSSDLKNLIDEFKNSKTINSNNLTEKLNMIATDDIRIKKILNYFFKNSPKNVLRLMLVNTTILDFKKNNNTENIFFRIESLSLSSNVIEVRDYLKFYVIDEIKLFIQKYKNNKNFIKSDETILLMKLDINHLKKEFNTKCLMFLSDLDFDDIYNNSKLILEHSEIDNKLFYEDSFYFAIVSMDKKLIENKIVNHITIKGNSIIYRNNEIDYNLKLNPIFLIMVLDRIYFLNDFELLMKTTLNLEVIDFLLANLNSIDFKLVCLISEILISLLRLFESKDLSKIDNEIKLKINSINEQEIFETLTDLDVTNIYSLNIYSLKFKNIIGFNFLSSDSREISLLKLKILENTLIVDSKTKNKLIKYGLSGNLFKQTSTETFINIFSLKSILDFAIYGEFKLFVLNILLKKDIVCTNLFLKTYNDNKLQTLLIIKKNLDSINKNRSLISTVLELFDKDGYLNLEKKVIQSKMLSKIISERNQKLGSIIEAFLDVAHLMTKPTPFLEFLSSTKLSQKEEYKFFLLITKLYNKKAIDKTLYRKWFNREVLKENFELKKVLIEILESNNFDDVFDVFEKFDPKKNESAIFDENIKVVKFEDKNNDNKNDKNESVIGCTSSMSTNSIDNITSEISEDSKNVEEFDEKNEEQNKNSSISEKNDINNINNINDIIRDISSLEIAKSLQKDIEKTDIAEKIAKNDESNSKSDLKDEKDKKDADEQNKILSPQINLITTPSISQNSRVIKFYDLDKLLVYLILSDSNNLFMKLKYKTVPFNFVASIYDKTYKIKENRCIFLKVMKLTNFNKKLTFSVSNQNFEFYTNIEDFCSIANLINTEISNSVIQNCSNLAFGLKKYEKVFQDLKYSAEINEKIFKKICSIDLGENLFLTKVLDTRIVIKKTNKKILLKSDSKLVIDSFNKRL